MCPRNAKKSVKICERTGTWNLVMLLIEDAVNK